MKKLIFIPLLLIVLFSYTQRPTRKIDTLIVNNEIVNQKLYFGNDSNYIVLSNDRLYFISNNDTIALMYNKNFNVESLTLKTSVWKSWDVDPQIWAHPLANSMTLNNEDNFSTLDANPDTDESITYVWAIPAQYKHGDSVAIHLKYFVDTECSTDTSVVFGLEYKLLEDDDIFDFDAGTTTALDTAIFTCTAKQTRQRFRILRLNTSGFTHEKSVLLRIFRDADNGEDNYDGDLRIWELHVDYKSNRIGE